MREFDYSFLANQGIPAEIVNLSMGIGELKAMAATRKDDFHEIFTHLESVAKVQSVKGSNAIEGIVSTDKRIEQIVNQESAPRNHSEMEIAGYRDALNVIHTSYRHLKVNEEEILRLHGIMLKYVADPYAGSYKAEDNIIMDIDPKGTRSVRFDPLPAEEAPDAMRRALIAYREACNDGKINSLLLIPCFILDFLCIHPFRDGNGRMSRLLSLLLLYRSGFDIGRYISFEEQINRMKGAYYESLRLSSIGWHEGKNDYMPFVKNFIITLYLCYQELDKRFAVVHGKRATKERRIEATLMDSLIPLAKKEICNLLPDVSETTVERVLGSLVKSGKIEKLGTNRSAKYIKKA